MTKLAERLHGTEIGYCYAGLLGRTELFKHNYPFDTQWGKFYALWFKNGYKTFHHKKKIGNK